MVNRSRQLSIQDKLFTAFAFTILLAALSVAISLSILLKVQTLSSDLVRAYRTAHEVYQAQTYLQEMERIERVFLLSRSIDELDTFLIYLALFEDYARRATLEASSPQARNALYEIAQAQTAYAAALGQASKAVAGLQSSAQTDTWIEQADLEMRAMRAQLALISQEAWETFRQAEIDQKVFLSTASTIGLASLVVFLILAVYTARVIRQGIFVPAARLSQAARALQENRFSPDMLASLARSPDEIGQLGRAFLQLAAALEAEEAAIQAQIDEIRLQLGKYNIV